MKVTVKVEGLRELDAALASLGEEIGPRRGRTVLRQTLQDIAKPIAADARSKVRVDKGALQRSIKVGGTLSRSQKARHVKQSDIEVFIGPSNLPQAITEEFGTSKQAPHPFLRPAWEAGKDQALASFKEAMWARIDKAAKAAAKRRAKG